MNFEIIDDIFGLPRNRWGGTSVLERELQQLSKVLRSVDRGYEATFPMINLWADETEAVVLAEVPGLKAEDINLTIEGQTLTVAGSRSSVEPEAEKQRYLLRERGAGTFERKLQLPFMVDQNKVTAHTRDGMLRIVLPRHENSLPKKIAIKAA